MRVTMRRAMAAVAVALVPAAFAVAAVHDQQAFASESRRTPRPTPATVEHRAVVTVDTGAFVKTACVRFREQSISGVEALRRAGMAPELRTFGGQGAAVCSLCGKGCPADGSCLTCGGSEYWSYFRKPAGSGGFTYARGGAGSAQVRDGDVEGWKWGTGSAAPPAVSVDSVCGPATVIEVEPEPAAGGSDGVAAASTPATTAPSGDPGTPVNATDPAAPVVAGTAAVADPADVVGAAPAADRAGGSPVSFVLVGLAIALVVGGLVWWSGRRRVGSSS